MIASTALPFTFAGMAMLSLAMDRHARQAGTAALAGARRCAGWVLLALSLVAVAAAPNWRLALVEWVGLLGLGAALVALLLFYRPAGLRPATIGGIALGVAAWLVRII